MTNGVKCVVDAVAVYASAPIVTSVERISEAPARPIVLIRALAALTAVDAAKPRLIRAVPPSCLTTLPNESNAVISIEPTRVVPLGRATFAAGAPPTRTHATGVPAGS